MGSYYEVIKRRTNKSSCSNPSTTQIGIIYGDLEIIRRHYISKGIIVELNLLNVIDEDAESKAVPYSRKIWKYIDTYVATDSLEKALLTFTLFCIKEGVEFTYTLSEFNVAKCELVDGVPKFSL